MTVPAITVEFYDGAAWQDVSADVVGSFQYGHGLLSPSPTDRVSPPGMLECEMDNSAANSGAKLGYYSYDHANVRTGWRIGAKLRVKIVSGGNTRYDLYRIKDIQPAPGLYASRRVAVTAVDYMDEFEIRKLTALTVQTGKRGDELLTTLVASMPIAPTATSYDTGLYLLPYAFHDDEDENTYCVTVLQKIGQSDLSYIYVDGNATGGETLHYEQPQKRYTTTASAATFSNTMIEMDLGHGRDDIYNNIKVTTNPVEVGTAIEVVASVPAEIPLEPSEHKIITLRYIDSSTDRRISAINLQTATAGTDYNFSSRSGTQSGDLNGSLTAVFTQGANSVSADLTNGSATQKGYVLPLQARGNKVTTNNKVESISKDTTSINTYGERTLNFNMPYQSSANVGKVVADELLRRTKDEHTQIKSITYNANRNSTFMGYALTLFIGSRITVTETVSGVSTDFFVNGMEFNVDPGKILNVTYYLERAFGAAGATYFVLDTSVLDGMDILLPL